MPMVVDYDDEDEGESSQDAYESDFINDGKEEVAQGLDEEDDLYADFGSPDKLASKLHVLRAKTRGARC